MQIFFRNSHKRKSIQRNAASESRRRTLEGFDFCLVLPLVDRTVRHAQNVRCYEIQNLCVTELVMLLYKLF
jgi:hypothetical protein